ncbi:MAG: hypothetical protein JEZ09_20260 [Salinivirgaceae bacterium]|nr:hypothetical protein [Salinivirgaceae bacterium]
MKLDFNKYSSELEHFVSLNIDKFFILPIVVLFPVSIISFVLTQIELFHYEFSFTREGLDFYCQSFSNFKLLFASTLAICTTYWGVLSIKQKIKQDKLAAWKEAMDERVEEKNEDNPIMCREIKQIRTYIFEDLYKLNFKIKNKKQFDFIFDKHFSKLSGHFETCNKKRERFEKIYPNKDYSYSLEAFQFIFFTMITKKYDGFTKYLQNKYKTSIKVHKIVNQKKYQEIKKKIKNGGYVPQ